MISVVFTCRGRPALTELCLMRFKELMSEPHELMIAYDGTDDDYMMMLDKVAKPDGWVINYERRSRFALINRALDLCKGNYFMHLENDFYWENEDCLHKSLIAFDDNPDITYVRFEVLPFGDSTFKEYREKGDYKIGVMKDTAPYRFTFNPHLRRDRFPCGRFKEDNFTKQDEQHHNDDYRGTSACLFGNNFRHLGIYDEGGHYKPYYAERFTLRRGERTIDRPLHEFDQFCNDARHRQLFERYLHDNRNKHNKKWD